MSVHKKAIKWKQPNIQMCHKSQLLIFCVRYVLKKKIIYLGCFTHANTYISGLNIWTGSCAHKQVYKLLSLVHNTTVKNTRINTTAVGNARVRTTVKSTRVHGTSVQNTRVQEYITMKSIRVHNTTVQTSRVHYRIKE